MKRKRLRARLRTPRRLPIYIIIAAAIIYIFSFWRSFASPLALLVDLLLLIGGFLFWLFFFAQFSLPVHQITDRVQAFDRLVGYITGHHGPAIFIENGEVKERKGEQLAKGPGVILLDTASAAVLRTPVQFTRAVGPGVVFTKGNESIAGVVELRLKKETCGPREHEDPFLAKGTNEDPEEYEARQHRRQETRGFTRDGIEVVVRIEVLFRVDGMQGEGNSRYGYNADAVSKAIIGRNIDLNLPPDSPDRLTAWSRLPTMLAADVWKEYLCKYTLDELFSSGGSQPGAFETIAKLVNSRLTEEEVPTYDDFGHPILVAGQPRMAECNEFVLLNNRGLKVTRVNLTNLWLPESVEKQLVQRWKANWLTQAKREHDLIERRRNLISDQSRQEAQSQYTVEASQLLGKVPNKIEQKGPDLLANLLQGTLDLFRREPHLHDQQAAQMDHLVELLEWVKAQADDTEEEQP